MNRVALPNAVLWLVCCAGATAVGLAMHTVRGLSAAERPPAKQVDARPNVEPPATKPDDPRLSAQPPAAPGGEKREAAAPVPADRLLREGTELTDQAGTFKFSGDRTLFITGADQRRFVVLENLNLERVVRIMSDNPDALEWTVSGSITEYRGSNFLYIRRVTLKSRAPFIVTPPTTTPTSPSSGKPSAKQPPPGQPEAKSSTAPPPAKRP